MLPLLAAELIVLLHFGFIIFVLCGGLLVLRWPNFLWLHLPAFFWGALVEFTGRICVLTPLENRMRILAGQNGYSGGFIEQHLLPVIYPVELTAEMRYAIGTVVILINLVIYLRVFLNHRRRADPPQSAE